MIRANQYQHDVLRTANREIEPEGVTVRQLRLLNWAIGLGEVGELQNHIKKHVFHGHDLDDMYVVDELGDIAWYLAAMAFEVGFDLESVMTHNISKLRKRYPKGFRNEDSINREA